MPVEIGRPPGPHGGPEGKSQIGLIRLRLRRDQIQQGDERIHSRIGTHGETARHAHGQAKFRRHLHDGIPIGGDVAGQERHL